MLAGELVSEADLEVLHGDVIDGPRGDDDAGEAPAPSPQIMPSLRLAKSRDDHRRQKYPIVDGFAIDFHFPA